MNPKTREWRGHFRPPLPCRFRGDFVCRLRRIQTGFSAGTDITFRGRALLLLHFCQRVCCSGVTAENNPEMEFLQWGNWSGKTAGLVPKLRLGETYATAN
jgi:hypothetical protein